MDEKILKLISDLTERVIALETLVDDSNIRNHNAIGVVNNDLTSRINDAEEAILELSEGE